MKADNDLKRIEFKSSEVAALFYAVVEGYRQSAGIVLPKYRLRRKERVVVMVHGGNAAWMHVMSLAVVFACGGAGASQAAAITERCFSDVE